MNIPTPSKEVIEKYKYEWLHLKENYIYQEKSINKLFKELIPNNDLVEDILLKVSTLNDFYSTNIFSVFPVAHHIHECNFDERIKVGDPTLVNDIALVTISGKQKNFYSFATKYCAHHSEEYAIYDYFVEKMLIYFKDKDNFFNFKKEDLRNFHLFKNILVEFRKFYNIEEYSLRDIDKYLWIAGKEYFPKKY